MSLWVLESIEAMDPNLKSSEFPGAILSSTRTRFKFSITCFVLRWWSLWFDDGSRSYSSLNPSSSSKASSSCCLSDTRRRLIPSMVLINSIMSMSTLSFHDHLVFNLETLELGFVEFQKCKNLMSRWNLNFALLYGFSLRRNGRRLLKLGWF